MNSSIYQLEAFKLKKASVTTVCHTENRISKIDGLNSALFIIVNYT